MNQPLRTIEPNVGVVEVPDPLLHGICGGVLCVPGWTVGQIALFVLVLPGVMGGIVLITETLLLRSKLADGSLLRDRMLSGFCVRTNARRRTFRIATSVAGKQFRLTLGHWLLMRAEQARAEAMEVLRVSSRPG